MLSKQISKVVLGSAALAGLTASANASLVIDVIGTGGGVVSNGGKTVTVAPGAVVTFDVFANVTGNDADLTNDGLLSAAGAFLSGAAGTLQGTLLGAVGPAFTGAGFALGKQQDLDSDGDLDVGSNNNASSTNFFNVRSKDAPAPQFGQHLLMGTLTFTLTGNSGSTPVNFRPRAASTAGSWFEDGTQLTSSNFSAGAPVNVVVGVVPEPTTLGLAALGGLGLLARRRNA